MNLKLIAGLLIVYMISCGPADDEDDRGPLVDDGEYATPPGGEITTDTIIYLTLPFAPEPENVTVSAGVATVTGKTIKISGPFEPGVLSLIISWEHRTTILYYTVVLPDTEAPTVTGGTIIDGDRDIDHNAINAEAKIELTFNEDVTGHVALQTEDGEDIGWLGRVGWAGRDEHNQAILELVEGKELNCGTTYMIVGKVSDAAENETDFKITFDTEPCP